MNTPGTVLDFLHEWSGWFCHKLPDRSPHSGLDVFPVCFRCAGWQFGLLAAYARMLLGGNWRGHFPSVRVSISCVALMMPLVIDGLGNALHLWNSPSWFRGLTGLGVGLCVPWLLTPLAHDVDQVGPASLENLRPLFWPALVGIVAVFSLDQGLGPFAFRALAVATATGWYAFVGYFLFALVRSYGESATRPFKQLFLRPGVRT